MSPIAKRAVKIREARDLLTGKRVNLSEMYTRDALVRGLGTAWVAPGEGSTWAELIKAFGSQSKTVRAALRKDWRNCNYSLDRHTNLRLTGAPLTQTDRERWESGNVE